MSGRNAKFQFFFWQKSNLTGYLRGGEVGGTQARGLRVEVQNARKGWAEHERRNTIAYPFGVGRTTCLPILWIYVRIRPENAEEITIFRGSVWINARQKWSSPFYRKSKIIVRANYSNCNSNNAEKGKLALGECGKKIRTSSGTRGREQREVKERYPAWKRIRIAELILQIVV